MLLPACHVTFLGRSFSILSSLQKFVVYACHWATPSSPKLTLKMEKLEGTGSWTQGAGSWIKTTMERAPLISAPTLNHAIERGALGLEPGPEDPPGPPDDDAMQPIKIVHEGSAYKGGGSWPKDMNTRHL